MCGIAAIVRTRGKIASSEMIQAMVLALDHRGPDGAAFSKIDGGRIALGHSRLAIMDLAHGTQPLWSSDGRYCIVHNGEIYDHRTIRSALERDGLSFKTDSDSEVLMGLYARYGEACVSRLNGEFAFVLWDRTRNRIFAARDRFGIKPLHYSQLGNDFYFASEAKAIFASEKIEPKISAEFLSGTFLGSMQSDVCAFSGVRVLKPGCSLTVYADGTFKEASYWRPEFNEDESWTPATAAQAVRERFENAVQRRIVSDVPVASYLSGGIDSTAVTFQMARELGSIDAFTFAFPEARLDESGEATETAASGQGVRLHRIPCSIERLSSELTDTVLKIESPFTNINSIAKKVLSAETRAAGYKVVLTGEGSDEAFGGYAYFKLEAIWRMLRKPGPERSEAKNLLRDFYRIEARSEGALWRRGMDWRKVSPGLGFLSGYRSNVGLADDGLRKVLSSRILNEPSLTSPLRAFEREFEGRTLNTIDPFNVARIFSLTLLSNYLIPKLGDRLEMANGLEGRTPFLDTELWDLALTLPPRLLMDLPKLREKAVLRDAVKDLVPASVLNRPKHPFLGPSWRSIQRTAEGRALFETHLSRKALRRSDLLSTSTARFLLSLWRLVPPQSRLGLRLDPMVGSLLTLQLLEAEMPKLVTRLRTGSSNRRIQEIHDPARTMN